MLSEDRTNIWAKGKCRVCKYIGLYDWTDKDLLNCAAPCENCGAESYDI